MDNSDTHTVALVLFTSVYNLIQADKTYDSYAITPNRRRLQAPWYQRTEQQQCLPPNVERTTIIAQGNAVWRHGSQPSMYWAPARDTVEDYIHENDKWAIRHLVYSKTASTSQELLFMVPQLQYATAHTKQTLALRRRPYGLAHRGTYHTRPS
jgi:hypothetical protein